MDPNRMDDGFLQRYGSEEACIGELYRNKWPDGYFCPVCRHRRASVIRMRRLPLYECRKCRHQTSLTAGTVMEKSKTPLRKWFLSIYWLGKGANARELSRLIQVTYKTAWLIGHKIRNAMRLAASELPLGGSVQVNEDRYEATSFSSLFNQNRKRQPMLAGATLSEEGSLLRVKLYQVPASHLLDVRVAKIAFQTFIEKCALPESKVRIAAGIYNSARHRPLSRLCRDASRWLNTTFYGIRPKHLQAYLDEFGYRFHIGSAELPLLLELSRQCASRRVITYRQLTRKVS
ncbi:IS1595 family transposase [Cohnella xylanilytica]|uniref:IS1595 family transposase n=1 Tax=Cohnella xylanilytica TaxID=557555 RepID=A0A841TZ38_9BACL|nr:transposase [Cohnella xylanilytica]MBB6692372.1 IS1595 family transposase [Cohnella xylanilytica]